MSAFGKADIRGLLPKPQPAAHFYELGLIESWPVFKLLPVLEAACRTPSQGQGRKSDEALASSRAP